MSTSPYALDLRKKVISYLKKGHSQASCAKAFDLHLSTVGRWWRRYNQEGHVNPRSRPGRHGLVDPDHLIKYIKQHPDQTAKEIGLHFKVSGTAILKRLHKLGFSYKKKRSPTWKQMPRSDKLFKS